MEGGDHIDAAHICLMMNCAEICQTCANFLLSTLSFSNQLCAAVICDARADSCEALSGMEVCVEYLSVRFEELYRRCDRHLQYLDYWDWETPIRCSSESCNLKRAQPAFSVYALAMSANEFFSHSTWQSLLFASLFY